MTRAFITVAIASSIGCGGLLLGLFDDDEEPVPTPVIDGGGAGDVARDDVGSSSACVTMTDDFSSYTDQTQLPDAGWRRNPTEAGCGKLGFDGGAFVGTTSGAEESCQAGIFRRFENGARKVTCSFDVTVNSFATSGLFMEYRVTKADYPSWLISVGWANDGLRVNAGATLPDGGSAGEDFASGPTPLPGVPFRVTATLVLGGTPTFVLAYPGGERSTDLVDPGTPELVELYVGVTRSEPPARAVAIDNVSCTACP